MWKYEGVYRLLEKDDKFDPMIIVVPTMNCGSSTMVDQLNHVYDYFKDKRYNVISCYDTVARKIINIRDVFNPDIIFYTNPYKGLIEDSFYIDKFPDKLTCYVQYAFNISEISIVNQVDLDFHNMLWKHYAETEFHHELSRIKARNQGKPGLFNNLD